MTLGTFLHRHIARAVAPTGTTVAFHLIVLLGSSRRVQRWVLIVTLLCWCVAYALTLLLEPSSPGHPTQAPPYENPVPRPHAPDELA